MLEIGRLRARAGFDVSQALRGYMKTMVTRPVPNVGLVCSMYKQQGTEMSQIHSERVLQIVVCMAVVVMGSVVILSFGVFLPQLAAEFDAQVGRVSIGISIATLAVAFSSPIVGRQLDSKTVRSVLLSGGVLLVAGLSGASFAGSVTQIFACYLLLGVAVAVFAPMVAVKHMSDWFPDRIGLATGLVALPVGAVFFPPLTQWLVEGFGWRQTFQIYAAATAAVMLLLFFLRPAPAFSGRSRAEEHTEEQAIEARPLGSAHVYGVLTRSGTFWFGILARCILMAGPAAMIAHLVVVAQAKGLEMSDGVYLLSIMGTASLIGAPLSGLVADRLGLRAGFVILAVAQGISLGLLSSTNSYLALILCVIILGFFLSASFIFFASYCNKLIGRQNFGTGFGLATLITMVLASFPPGIAGLLYDHFGNYDLFFGTLAALAVAVGAGAWLIGEPGQVEYGR